MKYPKGLVIAIIFSLLISVSWALLGHKNNLAFAAVNNPAGAPIVNTDDLKKAGYVNARQEPPRAGRFVPPTLYFSVGPIQSGLDEKQLLMVSVVALDSLASSSSKEFYKYGDDNQPINIAGASFSAEGTISDGRTAINLVKGNKYAVIIGPEKTKIESLAQTLASRI